MSTPLAELLIAQHACDRGAACRCPACGRPTDSLKRYRLPTVFFLGFAASFQLSTTTGCPGCVRRHFLLHALLLLPFANVFWPVVLLPTLVLRLVTSYRAGASAFDAAGDRADRTVLGLAWLGGAVFTAGLIGLQASSFAWQAGLVAAVGALIVAAVSAHAYRTNA